MNRIRINIAVILAVTLLLTFNASTPAGAKGGKQGGTQGGMQGAGQSMRPAGSGGQERKQIHTTDRHRDRLRTCAESAEQVRARARNMEQSAAQSGFNPGKARRECNQLHKEVQAMTKEHERFMQGLSDDQKARFQNRISTIDQARDRVRTMTQEMDRELNQKNNPNPEVIGKQAREINQAMNEWEKQYHYLESEIKE